jgi:hypothetical protein
VFLNFIASEEHLMDLSMSVCRVFYCSVTAVTLELIVAMAALIYIVTTIALYHIAVTVTLDTIVAFVIHLIALLMLSPVMFHKEHLWNYNVLHTVHLSSLIQRCTSRTVYWGSVFYKSF